MSTEKRTLIKSTGVVSFATSLSRILGFVRDVIIARLFGTGIFTQAFVVAFRIPNMLRDLVGEGATNAAVVPILTEYRTVREEKDYWELVRVLLNICFVVLSAIAVLGMFVAPVIVRLIAPGFIKEPARLAITITLTRMLFPYVVLIGLAAYGMGVLNSLRHFAAPAFGSALLNISVITAALLLCPRVGVEGLAYGVLAGGLLQLCLQAPVLYRKGLRLKRSFRLAHPAVRRIGVLLVPRMLGTAVYQLNVFIDTILASFFWIVGSGGVAALYYSNRLLQLPVAIFGLALAQVTLPAMSSHAANNDIGKLKETISFSLRTVFFILIPASIGLMVLGKPIVTVLFQRGAFDAYSTRITNHALFFYCFGLFAYAGIKILVNSFYSLQDTKTPVKTAACALLVNTVLNLILMWPLAIGGLALATSIAGIFNFLMLFFILQRRIGRLDWRPLLSSSFRVLIAALVMGCTGAVLANTCPYFDFAQGGMAARLARLIVLIGINIAVFIVVALALRVKEARRLLAWKSGSR